MSALRPTLASKKEDQPLIGGSANKTNRKQQILHQIEATILMPQENRRQPRRQLIPP
jgi:hypothetical protein